MFDRHEQAVVVADALDVSDGDVGAFYVLLDENPVRVLAQSGAQ